MMTFFPASRRIEHGGDDFQIHIVYPGSVLGDRDDRGLGPLGRIDHARVRPGVVVAMHPHQNDEILTYLRTGAVIHEDSAGNKVPVNGHHMMLMNAGSGLMHEETNASGIDVTGLQIFVRPETKDLPPRVQFHDFEARHSDGAWRLVAGPEGSEAPLIFRSAVKLSDRRLRSASTLLPDLEGMTGFLYVFSGAISGLGDLGLEAGDGLVIEDEEIELRSDGVSELVLFVLDTKAPFSRAGAFSG